MDKQTQLDLLFSKLSTQEKQFLYTIVNFPQKTKWEHIYQAWKEVPKVQIELESGCNIVPLYSGQELVHHYEDLREESLSGKPSQVIPKKLGLRGPQGEPRTSTVVRDDTLEMIELPLTSVDYSSYDPRNFDRAQLEFKTFLYLWPSPVPTIREHLVYGFTYSAKRPVKI